MRHVWPAMILAMLLGVPPLNAQDAAPPLALKDVEAQSVSLDHYRGKAVVLNFWATWCGPCAEEMPWLAKIQKVYGEQGVVVIGVALDDSTTEKKIPKFIRKKKINFPVWTGGTTDHLKQFGLGEALPATAFINREGQIEGRVLGMLRKKDLTRRVEWLLGIGEGEPPEPLANNIGD